MKHLFFIFCFNLLLCAKANAQQPNVSKGSVVYFTFNNSKFITSREIAVWLPSNYNKSNKYSVIYMQDAKSLFDTAVSWNHQTWEVDETLDELIVNNKIKNCIVVGIYNAESKRRSEYFPQKVFDSLAPIIQDSLKKLKDKNNSPIYSGAIQSDPYLKFMVTELKPYIDSTLFTISNKENTFICGSSMGALISLYGLCEYPDVFGGAICISTHWTGTANFVINEVPEAILAYFKTRLPIAGKHKIYFDYGSTGLDSLYKPYQNKIDELMKAKNYDAANWMTKEFIGQGHDEKAWSSRLNIPFEFLLKK